MTASTRSAYDPCQVGEMLVAVLLERGFQFCVHLWFGDDLRIELPEYGGCCQTGLVELSALEPRFRCTVTDDYAIDAAPEAIARAEEFCALWAGSGWHIAPSFVNGRYRGTFEVMLPPEPTHEAMDALMGWEGIAQEHMWSSLVDVLEGASIESTLASAKSDLTMAQDSFLALSSPGAFLLPSRQAPMR